MADPREELSQFFEMFYGDQTGYSYSPVKDPEDSDGTSFTRYWFEWPAQKQQLIEHCLTQTGTKEVYFSPALFTNEGAEKADVFGSYYVWCEFDGNAPSKLDGLPEPTVKIQSSEEGNQHWYWLLDHFETDWSVLEGISQRIAYQAKADLGCWNANRVLRPINTLHHESDKIVHAIRPSLQGIFYTLSAFGDLPELSGSLVDEENIGHIPAALSVVAKYPWPTEMFEFFITNTLPTQEGKAEGIGYRSAALTKLAHFCVELGMTNGEAFSVLLHADNRWGKFKNRRKQRKSLINIINYCRTKHPIDPVEAEVDSPFRVFSWDEFNSHPVEVDWVVPGLVHKKGIVIMAGPPGVGKSQLTLRFMEKMAKGDAFLKWKAERPIRVLYISMEMPFEELKFFTDSMKIEENDDFRENFFLLPIGSAIKLTTKKNQKILERIMDEFHPDGVVFDSLGKAINDNLSDDKIILETYDYLKSVIQRKYNCFIWFIHHNRKGQIGNKKPDKLDDLYGNQYIGGDATTVLQLNKNGANIELACTKLRMAEQFRTFLIKRTPNLDFQAIEGFSKSPENQPIFGSFKGDNDSPVDLDLSI